MATFVFNGSESLNLSNFNTATDTVVLEGFDVADVAAFDRNGNTLTLVLTSGVALTLSGTDLSSLSTTNFSVSPASDIVIQVGGTGADAALNGNLVVGAQGNDNITVSSADALIYGNQDNDVVNGAGFGDLRIFGGQGTDTITNFIGGSVVYGGLGADTIAAAGAEAVTIYGGNGSGDASDSADQIVGSTGDDLVYGNGGNDTIDGNGGADSIFGGQGNDLIINFDEGSSVVGGLGSDTIDATGAADSVTIYGGNTAGDPTDAADTLTGGAGDDLIFGNGGDDVIASGGGNDTIYGGQGDDGITFTSAATDDGQLIYGGLGDDTITGSGTAATDGAVTIYGGNGAADAADGDDLITASASDTTIYGNAGDDTLIGGAGDDTFFGGAGDDSIDGATGLNVATGGVGEDTFVATTIDDTSVATLNANLLTLDDFAKGQDTIEFTAAVTTYATVTPGGVIEAGLSDFSDVYAAFGSGITAKGVIAVVIDSGDLSGTTFVLADTSGDGTADEVVALTGFNGTLALSDFSA